MSLSFTRKLLDIIKSGDHRTSLLKKNIFFSFIIKGWTGLIYLLIVPITLNCLGEYKNGIWLTISAMLIWIDNMDIGLGNGLRNKLTFFVAQEKFDEAREVVSNTFIMLVLIIIPTLIVLLLLTKWGDIYAFLNVDPELSGNLQTVISIALIFVASTFVLKFIGNIYLGMQLPAVSNLLVACSYTLAFIETYILYWTSKGTLFNIAIANTSSPFVVYLLMYPITFRVKYPYLHPRIRDFNLSTVKSLFKLGFKFFLLQMTSSLTFLMSSIYMSRYFSPNHVTPYQITYRYFSIVLHAFTVICSPFWSATTDAFTKGDMDWIKKSMKNLKLILGGSYLAIIVMVAISSYVYSIWIGTQTVIPWSFTISMAIYIAILLYCLLYCYFLNGMNALNIQLICTLGGSAIFVFLTPFVTSFIPKAPIIIALLCISNLPSLFFNRIQFTKIINQKAQGMWKK